ncbi:polyketide cyclase [Streptomyces abyssalis]|uniref:Polyketide cyclase n=1 Tax=Streptomyces abyssalis TaxID=933944 RepID=A0A1E7JLW7_9ACTN|nr:polyketide cyclase [Streptomyces abyssalis]OEU91293.1 polyketide cyclase [Streptomyces abyssalis]OEV26551.1 polyketide cyclase [Streptomyces nanshensis]
MHALYRRWLDDLWNGSPGAAAGIVSPDFTGHWPGREVRGPEGLAAAVTELREMFSEISFTLEVGPFVEGDLVAARWTGRGVTPEGTVTFTGNDILRASEGRFAEYWVGTVTQP